MAGPVGEAFVAIKPTFGSFGPDAEREIARQLAGVTRVAQQSLSGVTSSAQRAAQSVAVAFRDTGGQLRDAFGKLVRADTFDGVVASSREAARDVERAFRGAEIPPFDTSPAEKSLRHLETEATGIRDKLRGTFKEVGVEVLSNAASNAASKLNTFLHTIVRQGLDGAGALEQVHASFVGLFQGDQGASDAFIKRLQDFAAKTPFEFDQLTHATQTLIGGLNLTGDEAIGVLTDIGNAAAAAGASGASIDAIITPLAQINSLGKLTQDNLNQISNQIPSFNQGKVFEILAKNLGITAEEAHNLAEKGDVLAKDALPAILEALREVPGAGVDAATGLDAMGRQSLTLNGLLSTLHDTVSQRLASAFTPLVGVLKGSLDQVTTIAGRTLDVIGPAIGKIASAVIPIVLKLVDVLGPVLGKVLDQVGVAFDALEPSIGPLATAIGDLLIAAAPLIPVLGQVLAAALQSVTPLLVAITPLVTQFANTLTELLNGPLKPLVPLIASLVLTAMFPFLGVMTSLLPALEPLLPVISTLLTTLADLLNGPLKPMVPVIAELLIGMTALDSVFGKTAKSAKAVSDTAGLAKKALGLIAPNTAANGVGKLGTSLLTLVPGIEAASGASAGLSISLGPVLLTIAAVAAAALALYLVFRNWDTIVEFAGKARDAVVDFVSSFDLGALIDKVKELPGLIGQGLSALGGQLASAVGTLGPIIGDAIVGALSSLGAVVMDQLAKVFNVDNLTNFVSFGAGLVQKILEGFTGAMADAPRLIGELLGTALETVGNAISTIPGLERVGGIFTDIGGAVRSAGDAASNVAGIFQSVFANSLTVLTGLLDGGLLPAVRVTATILEGLANTVVNFAGTVIGASDNLKGPAALIAAPFAALGALLSTVLVPFAEFFAGQVVANVQLAANLLGGVFLGAIDGVRFGFDGLMQTLSGVVEIVTGFIDVFSRLVTGDFSGALDGLKQVFGGLGDVISGTTKTALAPFVAIIGTLRNVFSPVVGFIQGTVGRVFSTLADIVERVTGFFSDLPAPLKLVAAGLFAPVTAVVTLITLFTHFGDIIDALGGLVTDGLATVIDVIVGLPGEVIGAIGDFGAAFADIGSQIVGGILSTLVQLDVQASDFLLSLPGLIIGKLGDFGSRFIEIGTDIVTSILDTVHDLEVDLLHFFLDLPGNLITGLGDFASNFTSLGADIIGGIVSGITGAASSIGEAAGGLLSGIGDFVSNIKAGLGKALDDIIPDKIPGVSFDPPVGPSVTLFPDISLPNPFHDLGWYGKGGIFDTPTIIGVGDRREVLIPLEDPRRAAQLARQSGLDRQLAPAATTDAPLIGTLVLPTTEPKAALRSIVDGLGAVKTALAL